MNNQPINYMNEPTVVEPTVVEPTVVVETAVSGGYKPFTILKGTITPITGAVIPPTGGLVPITGTISCTVTINGYTGIFNGVVTGKANVFK